MHSRSRIAIFLTVFGLTTVAAALTDGFKDPMEVPAMASSIAT